jgi:hypothetical protein
MEEAIKAIKAIKKLRASGAVPSEPADGWNSLIIQRLWQAGTATSRMVQVFLGGRAVVRP